MSRGRPVTYGSVLGVAVTLGAALLATRSLGDNSFLTHLATGRLIVDTGAVPVTDPYSFTVPGASWVVQSWLASLVYATAEQLAGGLGLRLVYVALAAVVGGLVWRLSAPADGLIARLGLVALAFGVFEGSWSHRPFMFGCAFLALYLLACQRPLPGPLVLVCAWTWVNTHGSFPLGLVAVAAVALGRRLDGERPDRELSVLRWAAAGTLLGAVNPLGPRLLVFPLELLRRQDVLRNVLEWRSPGFVDLWDRAFVVLLVVGVLSLVRRPTWRAALPMVVFSVAALLGARNVVFGAIVLVATTAPSLAGLGSLRWRVPVPRGRAVTAAVGALLLLVVVTRLQRVDDYVLSPRFPVGPLALLEQRSVDLTEVRLVTHDYVGNLLTAVYPHGRRVYFDDRFDMYPAERVDGYLGLLNGKPGWSAELDRVDADIVIWRRDAPLSQILTADPRWSTVLSGDGFATFCRRGSGVRQLGC